jgi:3-hydroxyisobutyrate dehydrogenase-like beta-hydroxyacid dehydrogenase
MSVVGLLHPGEMGAAVGRCLTGQGHTVLWASHGRSAATVARAAGFADVGTVGAVVSAADVILSICPPHAAIAVAHEAAGFRGLYVDANAVSPGTAREVSTIADSAGFVDGGIIGGPPVKPGDTRLYLSGSRAAEVAGLFAGSPLEVRVMSGEPGTASAVKMAYAAWTKGTSAMLLAIRAMARAEGVEDALLAEWALSQPALAARSERAARSAASKGWRWIAEMEEIAATLTADGLPGGFHQAAAEIYRRAGSDPDLDAVLDALG